MNHSYPKDMYFSRIPSYGETIFTQASELLAMHDVAADTRSQYRFLITKYAHKCIKKEKGLEAKLAYIYGIPVCIVKEDNAPAIRLARVLG